MCTKCMYPQKNQENDTGAQRQETCRKVQGRTTKDLKGKSQQQLPRLPEPDRRRLWATASKGKEGKQ